MEHAFNQSTLGRLRQDDDRLQASLGYKEPLFPRKQASKKASIRVKQNFQTQLVNGPQIYFKLEGTCSFKQGRPWSFDRRSCSSPSGKSQPPAETLPWQASWCQPGTFISPQKTGACPDIPSSRVLPFSKQQAYWMAPWPLSFFLKNHSGDDSHS